MKANLPSLDWKKVRELFDVAVTLPTEERLPWLQNACGDDLALRTAVEKLLRANDNAGEFIEQPALVTETLLGPQTLSLDLTGQRIGPYRVLNELGSGGMGSVWLACRADGLYDKKVAIKLVSMTADTQLVHRFERERQILADLDHPNIVRLIDGGAYELVTGNVTKKLPYVVIDYVPGKSLRAWLKGRSALPMAEAVNIARQICQGLSAAHRQGIIHRDIKPENIIVADQEQGLLVKILDFGIAKLRQASGAETQTTLGTVIGTTAYMSPEQAAGAAPDKIDARSDVYSLGMVLYEMLTGQVAFTGDTFLEIINKHQFERPVPPSRRNPALSPTFDHVVMKALEKAPENRQQTMHELAEELQTALQQPAMPVMAAVRKPSRMWFIGAGILLLGWLLVLGAKSWWQGQERNTLANTLVAASPASITDPKKLSLQYAVFCTRNETVRPLTSFDRIQEGERIHFELQMPFDGTVYLLFEETTGELKWANPDQDGLPQRGRAGESIRVPEQYGLPLDAETGSQTFLVIYVPATNPWTMANVIVPHRIVMKTGTLSREPLRTMRYAEIPPADSEKITASLAQNAQAITFTGEQSAARLRQEVIVSARSIPSLYHRIVLNQSSRR